MELGMIGLGRMGGDMARRLIKKGHTLVVFDQETEVSKTLSTSGATIIYSNNDFSSHLTPPRTVWSMLPSGDPTESTIKAMANTLSPGDIVIDGGNANYKDSIRRANFMNQHGISFLDVGTSGGVWGLNNGYCLMVGGERETFERVKPIFEGLAPASGYGYAHVGPSGSGHFVKMIHNGIEYGIMQSYAEGFELLDAKQEFDLDLSQIADTWKYGSVIRSWLLDLTANALRQDPKLNDIHPFVEDSGEGRWSLQEAIDLEIPTPVIALSLQARFASRQEQSFGAKLLAAMRKQFGGHKVKQSSS